MNGYVLVVEDDHRMRELLVRQLSALRYVGLAVPDQAAARKAIRTRRPDVLIIDLTLGEADGLTLAESLRHSGIPMLASTGCADIDLPERVHDAGFRGLLRKPFTLGDLTRELERSLGLS